MDKQQNITIPKKSRKDFTPEERALYNQYIASYMRSYRTRDDVRAKQTQYKREYRARKKLEMQTLSAVC